jgi:hypothetical protein
MLARRWVGHDDEGTACQAFIAAIGFAETGDLDRLKRFLIAIETEERE